MHPTGGSRRVFKQFVWLEVGSGKAAFSRPAHQRVTQTVGELILQPHLAGIMRYDGEKGKSMTQTVQGKGAERTPGDVNVAEVTAWAEGLALLHTRIARHFVRSEPRRRALAYLKGLLGEV